MLGGGTLLSRSGGGAFRSLVVAGGRMDAPTDRVVELEVRSAQELRKVTTLQAKANVRRKIGVFRRFHFASVPRTGGKLKSAGGRDFANLLLLVARGKIGSLS
jgi:hypothetical protein